MSREIYRQKRSTDSCSAIIRDGVTAAWPICLGYAPIGLAFGVLAQQTGLTPAEIGLMSLPVFAGSAQFMPVSMLSGGAAAIPIILTTFTINLRHLLMSSSLAVHLRHPKDEPIYQEVSRGGTSPTRGSAPNAIFSAKHTAKIHLTLKIPPHIISPRKRKFLSI